MCIAWHHRVAGGASLFDQGIGPGGQRLQHETDLSAHVKAEVGRNLFIAAAAGVQLEPQRTDALGELHLYKMMNVLGRRIVAHQNFARL